VKTVSPEAFRYHFDDPQLYGFEPREQSGDTPRSLPRALGQHIRISERVLPKIYSLLELIAASLGVDAQFSGFVYSSAETNAQCIREPDGGFLIFISSELVKLLTLQELRFVIGHEFAHARFGHHEYPPVLPDQLDERRLELSRAAEITADRIGAMSCETMEHAIRAIVKTASGLDDMHLEFDPIEYLRQGSDLRNEPDAAVAWSTHPPLVLRARAIARFESVFASAKLGDRFEDRLLELDHEIFDEIDAVTHGETGSQLAQDAAFWEAASLACSDGELDTDEQALLTGIFGVDRVTALKDLLRDESRQSAVDLLFGRAKAKREAISVATLATQQRFDALTESYKKFS